MWATDTLTHPFVFLILAGIIYVFICYMERRTTSLIKVSRYYYPGSKLMQLRCWLMHPLNAERRAKEEKSEGWKWAGKHDDE